MVRVAVYGALLALGLLPVSGGAAAAQELRDYSSLGESLRPAPPDPRIVEALQGISADRLVAGIARLVAFGTRSTLSAGESLPPGQGVVAAADWIESELRSIGAGCGGCLEIHRDTWTEPVGERLPKPTPLTNVYAVLRGSDPAQAGRMYLVSGHYDSRATDPMDARSAAPGADDDGSGVVVSLECARVLTRLHPAATVVFAAVTGEEQGLYGSRHLAQYARREGWQLQGVLDDDIVGGNTTPGDRFQDKSVVRVFSEGIPATATAEQRSQIEDVGYEADSPSRELARAVVGISETYGGVGFRWRIERSRSREFRAVLVQRRDRFLRGGDHTAFNEQGFPAVRFTEWREDFAHQHQDVRRQGDVQYGDLAEFLDPDYMAHVTVLNAATLATLALAPPPPVNVRVLARALENESSFEWDDGPGAPAATRYELLWRETGASFWQRVLAVAPRTPDPPIPGGPARPARGVATHHALNVAISKDNVVFGLRAVDAAGHRSVAVAPLPAP